MTSSPSFVQGQNSLIQPVCSKANFLMANLILSMISNRSTFSTFFFRPTQFVSSKRGNFPVLPMASSGLPKNDISSDTPNPCLDLAKINFSLVLVSVCHTWSWKLQSWKTRIRSYLEDDFGHGR